MRDEADSATQRDGEGGAPDRSPARAPSDAAAGAGPVEGAGQQRGSGLPMGEQFELRLGDRGARTLINLLSQDHSEADRRGRHRVVMEPYGYRWYRVGGLGYLLDRGPPDRTAAK